MLRVLPSAQAGESALPVDGLQAIKDRIQELKREKDIVVLAHNYQYPEVQEIADIRGDTLELSIAATKVEQQNILFCGVDFMAEMAKVLNPAKHVFIPDEKAHCPLAGMTDPEGVMLLKERYPNAAVVAYVNSSAAVKAISDVSCASANAIAVVSSLKEKEIIFTPDQNFGQYLQRKLPEKKILIWPGYCHVHQNMTAESILDLKRQHPNAEVLVHPECPPDVIAGSDFAYSTGGMIKHCRDSPKGEFIVGTERELTYVLQRNSPGKKFFVPPRAVCPTHKKITIRKVLDTMETMSPEVLLPDDVIQGARRSLDRMIAVVGRE